MPKQHLFHTDRVCHHGMCECRHKIDPDAIIVVESNIWHNAGSLYIDRMAAIPWDVLARAEETGATFSWYALREAQYN